MFSANYGSKLILSSEPWPVTLVTGLQA